MSLGLSWGSTTSFVEGGDAGHRTVDLVPATVRWMPQRKGAAIRCLSCEGPARVETCVIHCPKVFSEVPRGDEVCIDMALGEVNVESSSGQRCPTRCRVDRTLDGRNDRLAELGRQ